MPSLEIKDVFDAPEVKPSTPSASPQVPQITKSFGHRKAWVVFAIEHGDGSPGSLHQWTSPPAASILCLFFVVLRFAVFRCKNQLPFL